MMGGNFSDDGVEDDNNGNQDLQDFNDYGENKENLSQWISKPEVVNYIRKKFRHFLSHYSENGENIYE